MKKRLSSLLIPLIFFIGLVPSVAMQGNILSDDSDTCLNIGGIDYFVDESGKLDFSEISGEAFIDKFKDAGRGAAFGFTDATVWIRMRIRNHSSFDDWFLGIKNHSLETADLYTEGEKNVVHAGMRVPIGQREYPSRYSVFPLKLESGTARTYYLKVKTQDAFVLAFDIRRLVSMRGFEMSESLFLGFCFSMILILLAYNIFLSAKTREALYVFSSAYLVAAALWLVSLTGWAQEYLWSWFSPLSTLITGILALAAFTLLLQYLRVQLDSAAESAVLDKLLIGGMICNGILFAVQWLVPTGYFIRIVYGLIILVSLAAAGAIVYFCIRERQAAGFLRFDLAGHVALAVSGVLWFAQSSGFLPGTFLMRYSLVLGLLLQVSLMTAALFERRRLNSRQGETGRESLIAEQRESLDEQNALLHSFARFVPREFIQILEESVGREVRPGDRAECSMTMLSFGVRSANGSGNSPQVALDAANDTAAIVGPIVRRNGGFIDKYINDTVQAFFPDHPDHAIDAVIGIAEELEELNRKRRGLGKPEIEIRAGIHADNYIFGVLGEEGHLGTAVVSGSASLAMKLQGLNGKLKTRVLISRETFDRLDEPGKYRHREAGLAKVQGREEPLRLIEILV